MNKVGCTLLSLLSIALALGVGTATAQNTHPDYDYDVGYFANANAPGAPSDHLRLSNDGSHAAAINRCANIFVFDNTEEMKECCSCMITPDGDLDLSVNSNLLGNILDNGTKPTRGIIKVVSSSFLVAKDLCTPTDFDPFSG